MKIKRYFYAFMAAAAIALGISSCTPDTYEMGGKDVSKDDLVEGIAYTVTHDQSNPNIVYLKSTLDKITSKKYTTLWEHPQGRSQASDVTLKIPFPGTYNVTFGVETDGGAVYGNPSTFTIDNFCADFVNDKKWTMITGGVGKSKTWIPDNGQYGQAKGEMDYADPSVTQEYDNYTTNWEPGPKHTTDGSDEYFNSSMTFSLDGGANVEVKNAHDGTVDDTKGTFMLDLDNMTITFTDVDMLHTYGWTYKTPNWRQNLKILKLTDNRLTIGVLRDPNTSGEGEWWLLWNFVSKEYADSYVPEDVPDPVPSIDGNANDIMTTSKSKTWMLSLDSPFDWADLNGNLLNGFKSASDYTSTGWAAYNADMIKATSFTFTSTGANEGSFTFTSYSDPKKVEGSYTVDKNNDITFSEDLNALISQSDYGWTSSAYLTTSNKKLRLLKTATDVFGNVTDMYLGQRSNEKDEYQVYHFVLGSGSTPTVDENQVRKDRLTGGSSRTWMVDINGIPATWANNHVYDNLTDGKKENYASCTIPDWTGYTYSDADKAHAGTFRLTFHSDGKLDVVFADGTATQSTWTYGAPADFYGMPLIVFPVDLNMDFKFPAAEGAWYGWETQKPVDNAKMPTTQWLEIYDWDLDSAGNVVGVWLGMDNGNSTPDGSDASKGPQWLEKEGNQRKVMHMLIDNGGAGKTARRYHRR